MKAYVKKYDIAFYLHFAFYFWNLIILSDCLIPLLSVKLYVITRRSPSVCRVYLANPLTSYVFKFLILNANFQNRFYLMINFIKFKLN